MKFISIRKLTKKVYFNLYDNFLHNCSTFTRFQLYIWLEREVEVLQYLCNYGDGVIQAFENQMEQNLTAYEGKLFIMGL